MTRRRFLAVAGGAGAAALAAYGRGIEPRAVEFTEHQVNARTSPAQRPVRIAQVTDLHLRGVGHVHRRIAEAVNRASPDLVVFTGDSVDRADTLPLLADCLALFDPGTPKYAIFGNWEHWAGVDADALADVYARANARLLVNETALHRAHGRTVAVTGIDDLLGGRPDPVRAFRRAGDADARVLLAHCPEHRGRLAAQGPAPDPFGRAVEVRLDDLDLVLSGHTHGGQVRLLGWAPVRPPGSGDYVAGWYRGPAMPPMYVCRGVGTSVLPVRIGARPEVAFFTLWA